MMAGRWSRASASLSRTLTTVLRRSPHVLFDLMGFAGAGAIAYGAWMIFAPAGFVVGGLLAMALSVLFGRKLGASSK